MFLVNVRELVVSSIPQSKSSIRDLLQSGIRYASIQENKTTKPQILIIDAQASDTEKTKLSELFKADFSAVISSALTFNDFRDNKQITSDAKR
jgi:hypothetical protein